MYAEDEARLERVGSTRAETSLLVRFATSAGVRAAVRRSTRDASLAEDASFRRAVVRRTADDRGGLQPVRPVSRATPQRPDDARPGERRPENLRAGDVRQVDGTNADDLGGHRPGMRAAHERAVASPLADLGFTKAEIRALSAARGIPTWDQPSSPCLQH